jgi:hypothetical protein
LEVLGVGGSILLKIEPKELMYEDVNCIYLDKDRGMWWAGLNLIMNLRVS